MAVDVGTFSLWQEMAQREDLPQAGVPAVVEALTTPVDRLIAPAHVEGWRTEALREALPALLSHTRDLPVERARLIHTAGKDQITQQVGAGALGPDDVPVITRAHGVWPQLLIALAQRPEHVPVAVDLLPRLSHHELSEVVSRWEWRHTDEAAAPPALLSAALNLALRPLTARLAQPDADPCWVESATLRATMADWDLDLGDGTSWQIMERCVGAWERLAADSEHGRSVQHLLLDNADTSHLSDQLLAACLPALTCDELAHLPKPSATQRVRLRQIARRVRRHPRLQQLAARQLSEAADWCVARGRLLRAAAFKDSERYVFGIGSDLALLSANSKHLARVCAELARCPQPTVVSKPTTSRFLTEAAEDPVSLLGWSRGTGRVETMSDLARNPHTPKQALIDIVPALHPLELAWLRQQDEPAPAWLRRHVSDHAPEAEDDGVLRVLTDDELDNHADPAAVLQSWLDAPHRDNSFGPDTVEQAILRSRHHTQALLRQLPARTVLAHGAHSTTAPLLLTRCGNDPARWAALLAGLSDVRDGVTFGEFLDATLPTEQPASVH